MALLASASRNKGLQKGDELGVAVRFADQCVDMGGDDEAASLHECRHQRRQASQIEFLWHGAAHENDGFRFQCGDTRHEGERLHRGFGLSVRVGVAVERPKGMAASGQGHVAEQTAQKVAVPRVGIAAEIPAQGRICPDKLRG